MILETSRLELKTPSEEFHPLICDYYLRNRKFLELWEPLRDDSFFTAKRQLEILKSDVFSMEKGESLRFWIFPKKEETVIGQIGFTQIIRGIFLSTFLGYSLDGDYINRGYMTESLERAVSYVLNTLSLHRVEANVMPRNKASLKVLEKLGFHNEGLSPRYLKINGVWEDHVHMVFLNDDPSL